MTSTNLKKVIKYVFFATITSIINVAVYLITYKYLHAGIIISNVLAYTISISVSFIINKKVVFKNDSDKVLVQIALYLVVKAVSFSLDSAVLYLLKDILNWNNVLSKIVANASTTISNYTLNNIWVFKKDNK